LAQCVYLVGALFIGIAYQPFILMLIAIQCGLWSYVRRIDAPVAQRIGQPRRPAVVLARPSAPA